MNPFDFVKAINSGHNVFDDAENEELLAKGYSPFLTNRAFSQTVDTILYAQELNLNPDIPNKLQYLYLHSSIKPRKRFVKWHKAEKNDDIAIISENYQVNKKRAKEILSVLSPEQLEYIKSKVTNE